MAIEHRALMRGIWVILAASAVMLLALITAVPTQMVQAADRAARSAGANAAALDVVILVDESGSETATNVAEERRMAATIAQSMLNPRSRVTVVGFGGVNNVTPNQDPVNVACQPTVASGAVHLAYLARCVNSLHRRNLAEGNDTDYAAALGQAMSYFAPATAFGRQSPPGAIKLILMMTDGGLDVANDTQQYGANWLAGAHHAVNLQLAAARAADVQVWPLGFGAISPTDQSYLSYLAANGAQTACDNRHVSKPHAMVVNDPGKVLAALDELYAAAGCVGTSTGTTPLGPNQTRWLQVSIPGIATDAAISVARGNPGVQVSFYKPDGSQWTDGSALSGAGTPVEVLHIAQPQAGNWRIKLVAPPSLARELVRATAFWQGAVDAVMTATPSSAQPGQQIDVTLSVLESNGPITDPATLAHLQVAVSVEGEGLSGLTTIPVRNTGESQGTATGAGDYKGTFTVPKGRGTLTFTGTAAGYGLYATTIPATVQVGSGAPGFQGAIQLPVISSVQTDQTIQGKVLFANTTGTARAVRLTLSTRHAYATIASPTGAIVVRPGNPPGIPFTITVAKNSPVGPAFLQVKVVDAAHPGIVYATGTLLLTVTSPPTALDKYFWIILGILVLLILGTLVVVLGRRARRKAVDVRGLRATISRHGEQVGAELRAPNKWTPVFRFVIRDEDEPVARLDYPQPGDPVYSARRGKLGRVMVATPAGEEYEIIVGSSGEPLPSGLHLAFRDLKRSAPPQFGLIDDTVPGTRPASPPVVPDPQMPSAPSSGSDPWQM